MAYPRALEIVDNLILKPNSTISLRNALKEDLCKVHLLNQSALPHVNSILIEDLEYFLKVAIYFKVFEDLSGFLIALRPGLDYQSENYQWFSNKFDDFYYIDRIVIAEDFRGKGKGSKLYKDLFNAARDKTARLTCEVNADPPNPLSLAFHANLGFTSIGKQNTEGGSKKVNLMSFEL